MDDVLEYAPECAPLFDEGGPLAYAKAWMTMENGEWYTMRPGSNTANSIDLSNSTMEQRVPVQVHGPYGLAIRQDWLDKLGLAMPSTPEEFHEALVHPIPKTLTATALRMSAMWRIWVQPVFMPVPRSGGACLAVL